MPRRSARAALLYGAVATAQVVTFTVPHELWQDGYSFAPLDRTPVGVSIEFYQFPAYINNVTATKQCLANWDHLAGKPPPLRIGGTTQDRAKYVAHQKAHVQYDGIDDPKKATVPPLELTYGPSFLDLAGTYPGDVVLGLNRGHNDYDNTKKAAKQAVKSIKTLKAIELGNEPDFWSKQSQPAIASKGWSPEKDAKSLNTWSTRLSKALHRAPLIQAGNWFGSPPTWSAAELLQQQTRKDKKATYSYSHHNYPNRNTLRELMDHRQVVANVHAYAADAAAAVQAGKPYVFGETNSHSSGGVAGLSSSFGAALWTLDYALRAAAHNVSRAYFHQTTLGRCSYCFWDRDAVQAPYYGATAAVAVLAGAAHIGPLDNGTTAYAAYATWDRDGKPLRALLYNSDYYDTRFGFVKRSPLVTLAGLGKRSVVRAKRLTAQDALAQAVDETGRVSFGSQTFEAETCVARGKEVFETVDVVDGQADFFLRPSEALVVYLQ